MRTNRTWLFLFLLTGSLSVMADSQADVAENTPVYSPQFEFQFAQKQWHQDADNRELLTPDFKSLSDTSTQIDRYIQGVSNWSAGGTQQKVRVEDAIPALHAKALFDLPLTGFSAGLEGSHTGFSDQLFDYRAQLRYEWGNGLGLQGGWQHQQMSLDLSEDTNTTFSSEGPYLDLNWRF